MRFGPPSFQSSVRSLVAATPWKERVLSRREAPADGFVRRLFCWGYHPEGMLGRHGVSPSFTHLRLNHVVDVLRGGSVAARAAVGWLLRAAS